MTVYLRSNGHTDTYARALEAPAAARMFPGGPSASWALSLWMRCTADPTAGAVVWAIESAGARRAAMTSNGSGGFSISIIGADNNTANVSVAADGAWHHVLVSAEAEVSFVVYVDGAFGDNGATEETYVAADAIWLFNDSTQAAPAAVDLSGVAVFEGTLSEADAAYLYGRGVDADATPPELCSLVLHGDVASATEDGYSYLTSPGGAGDYADANTPVAARVVFPGPSDLAAWTVSFWIREADAFVAGRCYAYVGDGATPFLVVTQADDFGFGAQLDSDGSASDVGLQGAAGGTGWNHILLTSDGAIFRAYENGASTGSSAVPGTYAAVDDLQLFLSSFTDPFGGDIRAPAIFSRALSAAEVAALYAAGPGHDLTTATGAYSAADPAILWDGAAVASEVPNRAPGPRAATFWLFAGGSPSAGTAPDIGLDADTPLDLHGWLLPVLYAFPTGTHTIRVIANVFTTTAYYDFEGWAFDFADPAPGADEAPRITGVAGSSLDDLTLSLDAAMQPGIAYTLTPPGQDPLTITGPRQQLARARSPGERVLLDIDAPIIRDDGSRGFRVTAGGDLAMSSDLATVEKAIWDLLLSPPGEKYWAPARGGLDIWHKGPRPLDPRDMQRGLEAQIERIPYVTAAVVQLLWQAGHMVISVRADTDFGRLQTRREVSDA